MAFLERSRSQAARYDKLGYLRNPFPRGAQVTPEVHVDRPETKKLQRELEQFVFHEGKGGFWAVEGRRGVGKSNLLKHIEWSLEQEQAGGESTNIATRYIGSQLVAPRLLAAELVQAIGDRRLRHWLAAPEKQILPPSLHDTDLHRWLKQAHKDVTAAGMDSAARRKAAREPAEFLMRWLGCQQTYSEERVRFGIDTKERLSPAQAFPYLRAVVDLLQASGHVAGILLLIDELEDLLARHTSEVTDYGQAIKALVNTFNMKHLFVIVAGQEGAVREFGQKNTSLAARWQVAELKALQSEDEAVELARAYIEHTPRPKTSTRARAVLPTDDIVRKRYREISEGSRGPVVQRALLDKLHDWIEEQLAVEG